MAYYIIFNNTEIFIVENEETLTNFYPDYEVKVLPSDYDAEKYIVVEGKLIVNPNYEEEQTAKRKANFESQFLLTSLGNYRLQPKGYANAQQSIDTVHNIVMASGGLTQQIADMVIFYPTPDFTKPEQCTEEWLVAHQTHPSPMTTQEWVTFYVEFTQLYAQKQYKLENGVE